MYRGKDAARGPEDEAGRAPSLTAALKGARHLHSGVYTTRATIHPVWKNVSPTHHKNHNSNQVD